MPTDDQNDMPQQDEAERIPAGILIEDILILLSVVGLFFCWYFRHRLIAQIGLWVILVLMVIVFVRRHRRFKREFKPGKEETNE